MSAAGPCNCDQALALKRELYELRQALDTRAGLAKACEQIIEYGLDHGWDEDVIDGLEQALERLHGGSGL